jgi:hypothetical protein
MCSFPASGQPPTVIFYVQSTARAANRPPQQGLGMQQRPEPHSQAALAAAGCAHAVADGNGMPGSPNPRLNHLFPLSVNGLIFLANSGTRSHTAGELSQGCDVPPSIRRHGNREDAAARQPRALELRGAGDQARRRK